MAKQKFMTFDRDLIDITRIKGALKHFAQVFKVNIPTKKNHMRREAYEDLAGALLFKMPDYAFVKLYNILKKNYDLSLIGHFLYIKDELGVVTYTQVIYNDPRNRLI